MTEAVEYRVFGSPGTGKTTYLTSQIQAAAEKHGADRLIVASFTRAAAHEVGGRIHKYNVENVGTLHAHGYRTLGHSLKVAETCIDSWNEDNPTYRLSGGKQSDVDEVSESGQAATLGDELFNYMTLQRALMIPRERWRVQAQAFAKRWDEWKRAHGIIDYTDMIEIPYHDVEAPPGNPSIGFFDEAQDETPLSMALIRKWGKTLDFFILAGDDDQCIYEWAGARPGVLLDGEPAKKIILQQSYRVPRTVHALAQRIITAVHTREPKIYQPRDEEGEVRYMRGVNTNIPEIIIRDMERYKGKRIMILASCSYMLQGIIKTLREAGIPFYNPYRTKNGAWNPLRAGSVDRLLAFTQQVPHKHCMIDEFEPVLDAGDFLSWYELIKAQGNMKHGEKTANIKKLEGLDVFDVGRIFEFFSAESGFLEYFNEPDKLLPAVKWFVENISADKAKSMAYPASIIEKCGLPALCERPKVIVGTIHSVKGGEADVVYVAPDLSYAGYIEANQSIAGRDAIARLKYVAYTRARETLCLLDAATNYTM
ncbi:MAG: ATP-dependent helicase [Dehalococcoidia bacterium]|jgi:superfamily I DNA/RNA helicase